MTTVAIIAGIIPNATFTDHAEASYKTLMTIFSDALHL